MIRFAPALIFLSGSLPTIAPAHAAPKTTTADLVVYGGTASGVLTAYSAAKEGLHVVLLEPGTHLGGMVTGGLSATDVAHFQIIGGYARDFYLEAAKTYGITSLSTHNDWLSEPHVGETILNRWVKEAGIEVHFHKRLKEKGGVRKTGLHLDSITTDDGSTWAGKVFADCSYEGDVMAQANVSYMVGREDEQQYGESLAGVRVDTPKHQFAWNLSPYNDKGELMPEVNPTPLAPNGSADTKEQAYNFRVVMSKDPDNRMPWKKPAGYDPAVFELFANYLKDYEANMHRAPKFGDVCNPVAIHHGEYDVNNNGPFSTDYIGHSYTYPDAGYAERKRIWDAHLQYTKAFFWFLSSDPRVPKSLQDEANTWGVAKDEFLDTDHWPNQLYIREGRRMTGQYVMKQADLQTERTKPDSIAMGSYNSDSHNLQRVVVNGSVRNEGDVQVSVQPYEISFRAMLPKGDQTDNLLVPVCLSATHVAYSSVRMEPQYMMIGQAAGVTAAMSIRRKVPVGQVDVAELQANLRSHHAILHLEQEEISQRSAVAAPRLPWDIAAAGRTSSACHITDTLHV